jgi:hypothetical protein
MHFNHSTSITKNLTLFIDDKRKLNVLNAKLKEHLDSRYSIGLKLTTHQLVVAKSIGYSSHNDVVHSLPLEIDVEDFVKTFVKQVNSTSSLKCPDGCLVDFIDALLDSQLTRKKLAVIQLSKSVKAKRPYYEEMGPSEFNMPFPVYVFLDHETNELYVAKTQKQYSPERAVFGIEEMFEISADISREEVNELLNNIRVEAEALLNESWVEWDGRNFRRESTETGNDLRESLEIKVDNFCHQIG